MTTISIIIPAFHAHETLLRAVLSLTAQSHDAWQAIVVSDDEVDYKEVLAGQGFSDPRVLHTSTSLIGSGCHHARNCGLPLMAGEALTWLDADDAFAPDRLARLLPLAERYGAAADRLFCLDAETGEALFASQPPRAEVIALDLAAFLTLDQPLVPLMMRRYVQPRIAGVELAEDVIANIRLLDQLPVLAWLQSELYHYYIRKGSLAHSAESGARFDRAYTDFLNRLEHGDGFGLSQKSRTLAMAGLTRKRALNTAFEAARQTAPDLTFQAFMAQLAPA
jgi:glycosyltransferase involved in cell wall biosynthesis